MGIMDGVDEGFFAWLSLVFLQDGSCLGRGHHTAAPLAIFDLGGASSQLTFLINSADTGKSIHDLPEVYRGTQFAPPGVKLYAHSYLGLGLVTAMHSMMQKPSGKSASTCHEQQSPCFPPNVTVSLASLSLSVCTP